MEVSQAKEEIADSVQLLSSAKLNLKQLIARAKVSWFDTAYSTARNW